jgi:hypothetical protein
MKQTLVALVALVLSACSSYAPDAGYEIVLVKKPWFFGHGGVVDTPVQTGRTYAALSTDGILVYMQPKKFDTEMTRSPSSRALAPAGTPTISRSSSRRWCVKPYASAE